MAGRSSSLRGTSASRRLVLECLRENPPQTLLNALSIAFAVAIMLTLSEVTLMPPPHHMLVITILRWTIAAMVWFALSVAMIVMAINRMPQVRERAREFAIVRMLGASFSFIAVLLVEETIFIALPGTMIGIVIATLVGWLSASGMPELFGYETRVAAWLWAGFIAATWFFCVGAVTAWVTTKQEDVLSALAYK